jgi:hypothetical protein
MARWAKPTPLETRTGKKRLGPLSLKQLVELKEESKRGRDKQRIQKEIDKRNQ